MIAQKFQRFEQAVYAPIVLGIVALVLFLFGFILSLLPPDHINRLWAFTGVSLVAFHVTFYLLRHSNTDRGVKASDYVFLALACGGLYGVSDVQANLAKLNQPAIAEKYRAKFEEFKKSANCANELLNSTDDCYFEMRTYRALGEQFPSTYEHAFLRTVILDSVTKNYQLSAETKPFVDLVKSLYEEMEDQVYQYLPPLEQVAIYRRLLAYYVLAIGIALRISRVSAELCEWHRPKDKASNNNNKLPIPKRGAHNAVWQRKKLALEDPRYRKRM